MCFRLNETQKNNCNKEATLKIKSFKGIFH